MPTIQETLNLIHDVKIEALFHQIYSHDKIIIQKHIERYENLIKAFHSHFCDDDINLFSTSGRTEIGGNHTDHNAGRVHGSGFAGTIQVFLHNDFVQEYIKMMGPVFGDDAVQILTVRLVGTLHVSQAIGLIYVLSRVWI